MSLVLLQLSDTHLGGRATDSKPDPASSLVRVIEAWHLHGAATDAVVLSGDIADDGSESGCRAALEGVRQLGLPVLSVSGNHDLREAVSSVFGESRSLVAGGWRILGVDTEIVGQVGGSIDVEQVTKDLDQDPGTPTVLVTHHPLLSTSSNPMFQMEGSGRLLGALSLRPWVKAALSGHLHQSFDWSVNFAGHSLRLLGAPSTWYSLRHTDHNWSPDPASQVGARVILLDDHGGVETELVSAG